MLKVCEQQNEKFDLKNNLSLRIFHWIPKETKIFTMNNFHMNISNSEFFPNYIPFAYTSLLANCMYTHCVGTEVHPIMAGSLH